jgi:hypothetical protein
MSVESRRSGGDAAPTGLQSPERRELLAGAARISVASLLASVLPLVRDVQAAPAEPLPAQTWKLLLAVARSAIARGVAGFADSSRLSGGVVNGSTVFVPPGSLSGDSFTKQVRQQLEDAGAPGRVAAVIASLAWEVWKAWAESYTGSFCNAIPDFAAVPAPKAPLTHLPPRPLSEGFAPGQVGITTEIFHDTLMQLLQEYVVDVESAAEIQLFAAWYATSFQRWFQSTELVNLSVRGPVPSFAPPYVPVGPVVAGEASGPPPVLLARQQFGSEDPAGVP